MKEYRLLHSRQMYFPRRMFYRFLLPSLLSSAGLSLGNIVDALVIGSRMGETGLAAIGIIAPIYMIYNVFDMGIAIGGSVYYTRLLGEGRVEEGIKSFNQMLYVSLITSVTLSVLGTLFLPQLMLVLGTRPTDGALYEAAMNYAKILLIAAPLFFINFLLYYYVRCDDNQRLAAIGFIVGNLVDIILNVIFVLTLHMGVKGAILATVVGKSVAICIYLPHLFCSHTILKLRLMIPDIRHSFLLFRSGFASSSQFVFQFLFLMILNHLLMRTGGTTGLAVFNVIINLSYVMFAVYDGVGAAIQPLVSTFYGEKNRNAQKYTLAAGLGWGTVLGIVMAFLAGTFAGPICTFFGLGEEAKSIGIKAVQLFSLSTVIGGYSILMGYYYQAAKRTSLVFFINFLRTFATYLIFSLLLSSISIQAFWWTYPATEFVSAVIWVRWKRHEDKNLDNRAGGYDESRIYSRIIEKREDLKALITETDSFGSRWSESFSQRYYVNLTVEEICRIIFLNGFAGMEGGYLELTLIANEDSTFELHIRDNATKHNPFEVITKKINKDNEEGLEGIGMLMVKNKTKEFFYRRYQGFNTITVRV